jgi:hypothetical protein
VSLRDRTRKPARRQDVIEARQRILILCEGEVTEPQYIEGFKRWCRNPLVEVEGAAGVTVSLVRRARDRRQQAEDAAKREKDENLIYDQVWCVFDQDGRANFNEAIKMAQDSGLGLAVSVPCIELWLFLHFQENPGAQDVKEMQRLLKRHVPEHDKTVIFDHYIDGYHHAHRRAAHLDENCRKDDEPFRNPSTGMYLLTEEIAKYSRLAAPSNEADSAISQTKTTQGQRKRGRT